jgi:hypothetical protein
MRRAETPPRAVAIELHLLIRLLVICRSRILFSSLQLRLAILAQIGPVLSEAGANVLRLLAELLLLGLAFAFANGCGGDQERDQDQSNKIFNEFDSRCCCPGSIGKN